jgi:hypothetical protein
MANDDPVSWKTWNGSVALVIMLPTKETDWPIQSRRKSRDTLSGVVSTKRLMRGRR